MRVSRSLRWAGYWVCLCHWCDSRATYTVLLSAACTWCQNVI